MMETALQKLIHQPSKRVASTISIALALIGCSIDIVTGTAYSPLIFYIPSVIYAAWFCGAPIGWFCVLLMIAGILAVNSIDLDTALGLEIELFNAVTRIATIILAYWLVRGLRRQMILLREANRRLEAIDGEKNKLFGVISHDLRSPFHAVLGYAELLDRAAQADKPERTRQYAHNCFKAARNAYELLENLLQWAQLQMKRIELVPTVFEAGSIVQRCIETHRAAAELKNVELYAAPVDTALRCLADFSAAETILRNLTSNALKFTPSGGRVTISAKADEGFVEFIVQDTGVGIPKNRLEKLFSLAAEPTLPGTQGERGIGLGLVLCRDLVLRCKGDISAESTVGAGSCFRFTLPIAGSSR